MMRLNEEELINTVTDTNVNDRHLYYKFARTPCIEKKWITYSRSAIFYFMSMEKNNFEKETATHFTFRFDVNAETGRVTLWDGADAYTFMLRGGKPFVVARPGERDISKEKWHAMMAQVGAILKRLQEKTFA